MSWSGLPERLENKIIPEPNSGCWLWIGACGKYGHGQLTWPGHSRSAHRAVYEFLNGPVAPELDMDHFWCNNPSCVNPEHVRPVSSQENTLRSNKTIAGKFLARDCCAQGHPFDEANTIYENRSRARVCRTCKDRAIRAWQTKNPHKPVEYSTAWRERNRDKAAATRRVYEKKNRAKINAYARAYRKRKREEIGRGSNA